MSDNVTFLLLPGSESRVFLDTVQRSLPHSALLKMADITSDGAELDNASLSQTGIFLCDPATRLKVAYDSMRSRGQTRATFSEFYRAPQRRNLLSRHLSEKTLAQVGFIGIQAHLAKSFLLAESWLQRPFSTVSPQRLQRKVEGTKSGISEADYAAIQSLHSEDVALYEHAERLFLQRYRSYQREKKPAFAGERRLIVHVGPPKTGTSAIQAWLLNNTDTLKRSGIHYPGHDSDGNRISSGNYATLLTAQSPEHLCFDDEKAQSLLQLLKTQTGILLLSSEHFFYTLPWLFSRFPEAEYVFYIRHPLMLLESNYHQHVKRHGGTDPFIPPQRVQFEQLGAMCDVARQFDVPVHYRYFDDALFVKNNLLDDFITVLPLSANNARNMERVNTQYRPGALELMKTCNSFASQSLKTELDTFFQSVSEKVPAFSLLPDIARETLQAQLYIHAEELAAREAGLDKNMLKAVIDNYSQPAFVEEEQRWQDAVLCLEMLSSREPQLALRLMKEATLAGSTMITEPLSLHIHRPGNRFARLRKMITAIRSGLSR